MKKKTKQATERSLERRQTVEAYEANEEAKNAAVEAGVPVDDEGYGMKRRQLRRGQEAVRKLGVAMADGPSVNDMVKTMEERKITGRTLRTLDQNYIFTYVYDSAGRRAHQFSTACSPFCLPVHAITSASQQCNILSAFLAS